MECPVCLEVFDLKERAPRILSCQHTLCESCAQRVKSDAVVRCPECRQETRVIHGNGLPLNFALVAILEKCHAPAESLQQIVTSLTLLRPDGDEQRMNELATAFRRLITSASLPVISPTFQLAVSKRSVSLFQLAQLHTHWASIVHNLFQDHVWFRTALCHAVRERLAKRELELAAIFRHVLWMRPFTSFHLYMLEKLADLHKCLDWHGANVFDGLYRKLCARQLLQNDPSPSSLENCLACEKQGLDCLATSYTFSHQRHCMQTMFQEAAGWLALNRQFEQVAGDRKETQKINGTTAVFARVCSSGVWSDNAKATEIRDAKHASWPNQLARYRTEFESFYHQLHPRRRLRWQLDKGHAEVQVAFRPGYHCTLRVSTAQMLALTQFQRPGTVLRLEQICCQIGMPWRVAAVVGASGCSHSSQTSRRTRLSTDGSVQTQWQV